MWVYTTRRRRSIFKKPLLNLWGCIPKKKKYNENCLDKITNDFTIKVRNLTDILGMIGNILNYKRDEEFSLENKYNVLKKKVSESSKRIKLKNKL